MTSEVIATSARRVQHCRPSPSFERHVMRLALWIVTLLFATYSLWATVEVGYLGIWQGGFANIGSTQITLDLVISSVLLIGFLARDCRESGRPWWPWAVLTLGAGSFGTLAYLLWPRSTPVFAFRSSKA